MVRTFVSSSIILRNRKCTYAGKQNGCKNFRHQLSSRNDLMRVRDECIVIVS